MFQAIELPFAKDSLEPHIDAATVELHYEKHHKGYAAKLNDAVSGTDFATKSIEELLANLDSIPEDIRTTVRNNGGGLYNHNIYWQTMSADAGGEPMGELQSAIESVFGSFNEFKQAFENAAKGVFGSGWAWLALDEYGQLHIHAMPNQDNPIMHGHKPILGIDVWEHAYYLKYKNLRPDYIAAWWNLIDWDKVAQIYMAAK